MSDFLQFVDRIPTLPNRKKITHSDSSVEYATVEYADEPIEEGTFLNKANLSRVNSIMGYNETSVEQGTAYSPGINQTLQYNSTDDSTNWTRGKSISNAKAYLTTYNDLVLGNITPEITMASNRTCVIDNSGSYNYLYATISNSPKFTFNDFKSVVNRTTIDTSYYIYSYISGWLDYNIDFKENVLPKKLNFAGSSYGGTLEIQESEDGVNYTTRTSYRFTGGTRDPYIIDLGTKRYIKLHIIVNGDAFQIYYMNFNVLKNEGKIANYFTAQGLNTTPQNNELFFIETPNFDPSVIVENYFNNKKISNILLPNSKYELIYDSINNQYKLASLSSNILFDITLTQAVNQIDLAGIKDKFEEGKTYVLIIIGTASNSSTTIYFGSGQATFGNLQLIYSPVIFTYFGKDTDSNSVYGGLGYSTNGTPNRFTTGFGIYENIRTNNTSYKFNIGTRIIIKELS